MTLRPQIATDDPNPAKRKAMARPIPRLPPVTKETDPASGVFSDSSTFVSVIAGIGILPRRSHKIMRHSS
jgi:hypothetical protein